MTHDERIANLAHRPVRFLPGDLPPNPTPAQRMEHADTLQDAGDEIGAALQRVLAVPGEDSYRLEYADAVEGVDAARAEFIRCQVKLAHVFEPHVCGFVVGAFSCWVCKFRRRERELLHGCVPFGYMVPEPERGWIWAGKPIRDIYPCDYLFSRGFVSRVTASRADWSRHAAAIRDAHPVTEVVLATWPNLLTSMWQGPPGIEEPIQDRLKTLYPGITFTLPPDHATQLVGWEDRGIPILGMVWRSLPDGSIVR